MVFRVRDRASKEVMAVKKLKMEKEKEGFPITALREINTLLKCKHENIVAVQEIVVGSNMDEIFIVMEFVEHDVKTLLETMTQPFLPAEFKTVSAVPGSPRPMTAPVAPGRSACAAACRAAAGGTLTPPAATSLSLSLSGR